MKPILFNTEMVRAILDGRKCVTRRLVKAQPKSGMVCHCGTWQETQSCANGLRVFTPPFRVGDILYVRESWAITSEIPGIAEDGPVYKADFAERELIHLKDKHFRWRPSIHMPKELARIFLRVTDVRAERLQSMEVPDYIAEGIQPRALKAHGCECAWKENDCRNERCANRDAYERITYSYPFSELWDSTMNLDDRAVYGWKADPWVWVIRFEQIEKPEN